jgi:nucleoside-diphosphate-sugar epimerase
MLREIQTDAKRNFQETTEDSPGWPEGHPFYNTHDGDHVAYGKEINVRICVIRLAPYVYGRAGSGVALFMQNFAAAGSGMYVLPGTARISTVHVDDAARLYLLLGSSPTAAGIYNATFETTVTQGELAMAIAKALGVECKARTYADVAGQVGDWFATFLSVEIRASSAKARREVGWECRAEKGVLEEIAEGSYVELAEGLRKEMAAAK